MVYSSLGPIISHLLCAADISTILEKIVKFNFSVDAVIVKFLKILLLSSDCCRKSNYLGLMFMRLPDAFVFAYLGSSKERLEGSKPYVFIGLYYFA